MSDDLFKYLEAHSSAQGEALDWVEKQTNIRTNHARMLSGAVLGKFLTLVAKMIRPQRILELGTFTGYSAICLAEGLAEGGRLDTVEINDEMEDLIREGFERAGAADRISLHIGDAKEILEKFRSKTDGDKEKLYDLAYIDANKREYCVYYPLVFDLVRPGGYILADNVLWDGKVYQTPMPADRQTAGIAAFNDMVAQDERVESVIIPVRDGLNIIRKKD